MRSIGARTRARMKWIPNTFGFIDGCRMDGRGRRDQQGQEETTGCHIKSTGHVQDFLDSFL